MAVDGRIRQDLAAMRDDMSKLRRDLGDLVTELMEEGKSKGADLKDRVIESGEKARSTAAKQIKSRPLLSILMVLMAGLLVGKLLDLRR